MSRPAEIAPIQKTNASVANVLAEAGMGSPSSLGPRKTRCRSHTMLITAAAMNPILIRNTGFVSFVVASATRSMRPDKRVDPETDPHHPVESLERRDRETGRSAEQTQRDGHVGADEQRQADRVEKQHDRIGPGKSRLAAEPGAECRIFEPRKKCHRDALRTNCGSVIH